tara:strand:+ start:521 stop:1594 length:1074 start_codon:yes stop_codon:yes gene_type:complete
VKALLTLHRWVGAVFGLALSLFGLSGALLVWKNQWLRWTLADEAGIPARGVESLTRIVERALQESNGEANYIVFSSPELAVNLVSTGRHTGFYSDNLGNVITHWASRLERLELWLFDLHHDLLLGSNGTILGGLLALLGLFFTLSGLFLWWRTRRHFSWRLWPTSFSRRDLARHHRNLGALFAPLLIVVMLTGMMMAWRPVALWLLSPFSSVDEMHAAVAPPAVSGGDFESVDWAKIITRAQQAFPDASLRLISIPKKHGDLIGLRMKQPEEWLPNGRTLLWFDPQTGDLIESKDALTMPLGVRVNNLVYPVHAAKVGGIVYQLIMTLVGLVVMMLGSLVVVRFWMDRHRISVPSRI